jgi:hypothetical protein
VVTTTLARDRRKVVGITIAPGGRKSIFQRHSDDVIPMLSAVEHGPELAVVPL